MKHALAALRRNKNIILDTCAIFIKEPLLEWVKEAQHQNYNNEEQKRGLQENGIVNINLLFRFAYELAVY